MLCSVPFPLCLRPVFLFLNPPTATTHSSVFLIISDYVFTYCLVNYTNKWTLKWAPGNKFLRLLGSLCARAHPENHIESSDSKATQPRWRKNYHPCTPIMYGGPLEIYDWLKSWIWMQIIQHVGAYQCPYCVFIYLVFWFHDIKMKTSLSAEIHIYFFSQWCQVAKEK